jgi:sRNA-binding carbon storage regulator CsrA
MLVLSRSKDTTVLIGDDIAVTVREFNADSVVVQIDCPSGLILKNAEGDVRGEPCSAPDADATPSTSLTRQRATTALKMEEVLSIGDEITVKVLEFVDWEGHSPKVRFGFQAPANVRIIRSELGRYRAKERFDPPEAG